MRVVLAAAALVLCAACNPASKPGITTDAPSASAPSVAPTASSAAVAPGGHVTIIEASEDSDALSLIRTKRLEAKADHRVLVVYVGAKWCDPCKKFKAEVASGRLDERLGKVTLLAFDADRDVDRLRAGGYTFQFVPFVALPGADGRAGDSQAATGKGGQAWRELLGKLEAWQGEPH